MVFFCYRLAKHDILPLALAVDVVVVVDAVFWRSIKGAFLVVDLGKQGVVPTVLRARLCKLASFKSPYCTVAPGLRCVRRTSLDDTTVDHDRQLCRQTGLVQ